MAHDQKLLEPVPNTEFACERTIPVRIRPLGPVPTVFCPWSSEPGHQLLFERFLYFSSFQMLDEASKCEVLPALSNAGSGGSRGLSFRAFVWMKLWSHVDLMSPWKINSLAIGCRRPSPCWMFIHSTALEKLPERSHIRAILKPGRKLRRSWERCWVTKKAIFQ